MRPRPLYLALLMGLLLAGQECFCAPLDLPVAAGFRKAETVRQFRFPADHGAHPDYAVEWWYYTASLKDAGGRRYGAFLTFFRVGLGRSLPARQSRWAARDVLFAHMSVTDISRGSFRYAQKTGRPVLGLAGYRTGTLDVFIGDWSARMQGADMRIRAHTAGTGLDLTLAPLRGPTLNGDRGLSRKGPEPGNANYYYSVPRLSTKGTLTVGGRKVRVTGMTWLDREWGTSRLSPDQRGWDWFSLRLSDGRDLMLYVLRDEQGRPTRFSSGMLTEPDGRTAALKAGDFRVQVRGQWRSRRSGAIYPSGWSLEVPGHSIRLSVRPLVKDQELMTQGTTGVTYWEGLCQAEGTSGGRSVTGDGYMELTGYTPAARR